MSKFLTGMRGLNYSNVAEGPMPSGFLRFADCQVPTVRKVVGLLCPGGTTIICNVTIYQSTRRKISAILSVYFSSNSEELSYSISALRDAL